jgi:hypothetical protein
MVKRLGARVVRAQGVHHLGDRIIGRSGQPHKPLTLATQVFDLGADLVRFNGAGRANLGRTVKLASDRVADRLLDLAEHRRADVLDDLLLRFVSGQEC